MAAPATVVHQHAPPDLDSWRAKLFAVEQPMVLTEEE